MKMQKKISRQGKISIHGHYINVLIRSTMLSILALVLTVSLSSCIVIPVGKKYTLHIEDDAIKSIEIFNRIDSQDYPDYEVGDGEKPIAVISANRFDEFCESFGMLNNFKEKRYISIIVSDPHSNLFGLYVKITYESGSEEFICAGTQKYVKAGEPERITYCEIDYEEWEAFILAFIETTSA
jgi:hypothetical protein